MIQLPRPRGRAAGRRQGEACELVYASALAYMSCLDEMVDATFFEAQVQGSFRNHRFAPAVRVSPESK
jgi:hypothetical protein